MIFHWEFSGEKGPVAETRANCRGDPVKTPGSDPFLPPSLHKPAMEFHTSGSACSGPWRSQARILIKLPWDFAISQLSTALRHFAIPAAFRGFSQFHNFAAFAIFAFAIFSGRMFCLRNRRTGQRPEPYAKPHAKAPIRPPARRPDAGPSSPGLHGDSYPAGRDLCTRRYKL